MQRHRRLPSNMPPTKVGLRHCDEVETLLIGPDKKAMAANANVQKRQKYDKGGNVIQLPPVDTSDPEALAAAKKYLQDQRESMDSSLSTLS
jgi:hypothetical protein